MPAAQEMWKQFKLVAPLGKGGMGQVFLAQDTALDRKVALKFLPAALEEDKTARERFLREAKAAAALDHPYICKIYEIGEVEGKAYIAMEYIEGTTLFEKIASGPLPSPDSWTWEPRSPRPWKPRTRNRSSTATSRPRTSW
jgi:serine/threonine protein kinase